MNILDQFPDGRLTREQEASLVNRHRYNELTLATMREAVNYTRTCSGGKIEDTALVSLCYESMVKLAARFDPTRGRFFAYCKQRLRGAIQDYWAAQETVRNAHTTSVHPYADRADSDEFAQRSTPEDLYSPSQDPEFERIDFHERWAEVSAVLAKNCTDRERALVVMVFTHNLTFEEAGSLFGISRAAAQAIVSRVIERVKGILNENSRS